MNYKHIEAVLKAGDLRFADCDGVTIFTDGHVACACPSLNGAGKPLDRIAEQWAKWKSVPIDSIPAGPMNREGDMLWRKIGSDYFNEAYFRCFDAPGVLWSRFENKKEIIAYEDGALVAVMMPMTRDPRSTEPVVEASDLEVFQMFACEANDYYLVNRPALAKEIQHLTKQLRELRGNRDELNEEIELYEHDLSAKQARYDHMAAKVTA